MTRFTMPEFKSQLFSCYHLPISVRPGSWQVTGCSSNVTSATHGRHYIPGFGLQHGPILSVPDILGEKSTRLKVSNSVFASLSIYCK